MHEVTNNNDRIRDGKKKLGLAITTKYENSGQGLRKLEFKNTNFYIKTYSKAIVSTDNSQNQIQTKYSSPDTDLILSFSSN